MFIRSGALERLGEILRVSGFYSPVHQDIYSAFLSLATRRQPIDLVTVAEELLKSGKLEAVGGNLHLAELASARVSKPRPSTTHWCGRMASPAATIR